MSSSLINTRIYCNTSLFHFSNQVWRSLSLCISTQFRTGGRKCIEVRKPIYDILMEKHFFLTRKRKKFSVSVHQQHLIFATWYSCDKGFSHGSNWKFFSYVRRLLGTAIDSDSKERVEVWTKPFFLSLMWGYFMNLLKFMNSWNFLKTIFH